jgi:hypothetical protein
MTVTVFIRYQLDPYRRTMFEDYARRWLAIIALISFASLASYEEYRAKLRADNDARDNFNFAEQHKFILAEERTFLRQVAAK